VEARAPGATWASLHADAYIADDEEFRRTLAAALHAASAGEHLVTTGIRPQFPATGYGYIHAGPKLRDVEGYPLHHVHRFVEKPDVDTARGYVQSGEYLWNPGVFVWRSDVILDAFQRHLPEIHRVLSSASLASIDDVYPNAPKETIDNGIMERADNVATIPATFRWSDIGSWAELWDVLDKDDTHNVHVGQPTPLVVDSAGNLVYTASGRLVALVGVENAVVIDTEDAVFVCRRDRAQDVKLIVRALQEGQRHELL
jgi:mannose-1-phosphate guanylyltransferase